MKKLLKTNCINVLLLISRLSLSAQVATLPLNSVLSPGDYVARDQVDASNGCKAQLTGNNIIHLFIDPNIQLPHPYQTQNVGSNGINPITRNLDYTLPVGATPASYQVTPTGGLAYSVPISLPPGTMNMVPQLSIEYNSQSASGILGYGWTLSGLTSISRCGQSIYHNGQVEPVQFTNDDWFVYGGNRLILSSGTYGQDNSTYATECESYVRITSHGTSGNGPESFTIETKDGITMELGNSTDSRFFPTGLNTAMTGLNTAMIWMVNKIYDNMGNYILFEYTNDNGEINIKDIKYTGNANAGISSPYNTINFYYDQKTDANTCYTNGGKINSTVILRSIDISSEGNYTKFYKFKYDFYNVFSLLTEIDEYGSDNTHFNPLLFSYDNDMGDPQVSNTTMTYIPSAQNSPFSSDEFPDVKYFPLDYNGDGLKDLVAFYADEYNLSYGSFYYRGVSWERWSLLRNNGNGDFTEISSYNGDPSTGFPSDFRPADLYPINKSTMGNMIFNVCDFDGDGKEDLVNTTVDDPTLTYTVNLSDGLGYNSSLPSNHYSFHTNVNLTQWIPQSQIPIPDNSNNVDIFTVIEGHTSSTGNKFATRFLDFDGDTKMDIFCYIDNSTTAPLSSSAKIWLSGGPDSIVVNANTNFNFDKAIQVDIDGDGKTEIANIYNNTATSQYPVGYYIFKYNNGQPIYTPDPNTSGYSPYLPANSIDYFGDFNGDGITDFIQCSNVTSSIVWTLKIGKGDGTYDSPSFSPNFGNPFDQGNSPQNHIDNYYFTQDVNGDGKTDVIELIKHPNSSFPTTGTTTLNIYYCTGNSFILEGPYTINFLVDLKDYDFNFGDFNGDGTQDILVYRTDGNLSGNTPTIIYLYRGSKSRSLTQAVNGLNTETDFEYKTLNSGNGIYTQSQSESYPINNFNGAFKVVSKVINPDGIGGLNETDYKYQDALLHRQGKGFLGFLNITSTNSVANVKQINTYEFNSQFYSIVPKLTSIYNLTTGAPLSDKLIHNVFTPTYSGKSFSCLPSSIDENDYVSGKTVTTSFTYDPTNGNILHQEENIHGQQVTTTDNAFAHYGTGITSKLTDITVSSSRVAEATITRSSHFDYNSNGQLTDEIKDPGMPLSVRTHFVYEPNTGVLKKKTISATGLSDRISSYDYDQLFRFVIKEFNPLSQITEIHYDPKWGKPFYEKGIDGLVTLYYYDGFGRQIKTITPDNLISTSQYCWIQQCSFTGDDKLNIASNLVYSITNSKTGNPTISTYYDQFNRSLITESDGYANKIYKQKKYDNKGNTIQETGNYEIGQTTYLTTTYFYQDGNRLNELYKTENTDGSDVNTTSMTYNYGGGNSTITVTDPASQQTTKISDATGKLIFAQDNGGYIDYEYFSNGLAKQITVNGVVAESMTYDDYGNQLTLTDKDAHTVTYQYDAFGQLTSQIDANNNTSDYFNYDQLGRLTSKNVHNGATYNYTYSYIPSGNGINQLQQSQVTDANGTTTNSYSYDGLNRVTSYTETIDGQNLTTFYQYDQSGNVSKTIYPGGFSVTDEYNSSGFLVNMKNGQTGNIIWHGDEMNSFGYYSEYTLGNGVHTQVSYNNFGMPTHIYAAGIQDLNLDFDIKNGNLKSRTDALRSLYETFMPYDNLNRLTTVVGPAPISIIYNPNGTIQQKSDAGTYSYDTNHPDGVQEITALAGNISHDQQNISYTPFNKINTITESSNLLNVYYGPDQQRVKTVLTNSSNPTITKIFYPNYEKEAIGSNTTEVYYINAPTGLCAMYVVVNGVGNMYYVYKDHLGSILKLTNAAGATIAEQSFDAWGQNRNANDWTYNMSTAPYVPDWLYRGFTGHEHLPQFALINMNGRCYDPVIGMMLSPDNYVQEPDNTKNFNRYSYCINNPLSNVDKDGNFFWFIFAAACLIGGSFNVSAHWDQLQHNPLGTMVAFTTGAAAAGGALVLGAATFGAATGIPFSELIECGAGGAGGFGAAFGSAVVAAGTSSMVLSIANNAMFHDPMQSLGEWTENMLVAGVTAGVLNGISALSNNRKFWSGSPKLYDSNINLYTDENIDDTYNVDPSNTVTNNSGHDVWAKDEDSRNVFKIPDQKAIKTNIDGVATVKNSDEIFKVSGKYGFNQHILINPGGDVEIIKNPLVNRFFGDYGWKTWGEMITKNPNSYMSINGKWIRCDMYNWIQLFWKAAIIK